MEFPIYKKYLNNKSYFKIKSATEFEELQMVGNNYVLTTYQAKILPDRVMIEDMINNEGNHWQNCTADEYEQQLQFCQNNLSRLA